MATSPHAGYDAKRNVRQLQKKMDGTTGEALMGDDFDMNDDNAVQNRMTRD
jgi:hypothetical protein